MTKYGSWEGHWVVPGIVPLQDHPARTTPGTPPLPARHPVLMRAVTAVPYTRLNSAMGLKSVQQLTLSDQISGFQGLTEVYNLINIGRINNHFTIPGTE